MVRPVIAYLKSVPIGNAIEILLAPPAGAEEYRVLRKLSDSFVGPADVTAATVNDGTNGSFVDSTALQNGTSYFYRAYYLVDGIWVDSGFTASAIPAATAHLLGPNVISMLIARLQAALKVEVEAGNFSHAYGYIPVLSGPPTYAEDAFPVVSVHLSNAAPVIRGIGEEVLPDYFDVVSQNWVTSEGWIEHAQFEIISWNIGNPDVRIALRLAIKKALIGNLGVFRQSAIDQVEISQSDIEDLETYAAPVYQTVTTFMCNYPVVVESSDNTIMGDTTVTTEIAFGGVVVDSNIVK